MHVRTQERVANQRSIRHLGRERSVSRRSCYGSVAGLLEVVFRVTTGLQSANGDFGASRLPASLGGPPPPACSGRVSTRMAAKRLHGAHRLEKAPAVRTRTDAQRGTVYVIDFNRRYDR